MPNTKRQWQRWQQCQWRCEATATQVDCLFSFKKRGLCMTGFFSLSIITGFPFPESLWSLGTSETFPEADATVAHIGLVSCSNCSGMTHNASEPCGTMQNAIQTLWHEEKCCRMPCHEECSEMLWHKGKMLPNSMAWKKNVAKLRSIKEDAARWLATQPNAMARPYCSCTLQQKTLRHKEKCCQMLWHEERSEMLQHKGKMLPNAMQCLQTLRHDAKFHPNTAAQRKMLPNAVAWGT